MPRLRLLLFILLSVAVFTTCKKQNSSPQWDVGVLGPLVNGSLGINNLINDTLLKVNPDSSLTLIYNANLYTLNIDSLVSIPDTTVETIVPTPILSFSIQIGQNQTIYQNTNETRLAVNNVQLRYAIVKSGKARFSIINNLHTKVLFTYTIPKATYNNTPFSVSASVDSATSAGPTILTTEYDLSGYDIDLTGTNGNEVNSISYFLNAVTDPKGPTVTLLSYDTAMIIQNGFVGVVPFYAKGYLGQTTLNIGPDSTALALFKSIKSGTLNLTAASMKLTIENDIGMDAQLKVKSIQSVNSNTNSVVSLAAPSLINQTLNINRAGASGSNTSPSYIPTFYTLQIDNSNSNFVSLLNNLPDHLVYALNLETNPLGNVSGDNDFVFADHLVNANVDMEIPLNLSSDTLIFSDTAAFVLAGDAILNNLGAGSFIFDVNNGFPFALNITLVTIDSVNHFLDMLVSSAPVAAPPLDANLKVISSQIPQSQFIIPVDDARIALLSRAKRMIVTASFTTAAGAQHVKIYSDYTLNFKLIADLIYHVRSSVKKGFLIVLFIGCLYHVKAQNDSLKAITKTIPKHDSYVYFNSGYSFGSNAMTNQLLTTYLDNGFITDAMKDKVISNLKNTNRIGGDFNSSLGCKIHKDTLLGIKNVFYTIELKDANHIDAGFSKDLFEIYFNGNPNYGGRTADFSNSNFNLLQYQELKLGLSKDYKGDSTTTTVSAGISIVNGQNFLRIKAGNATLYTDPNGQFINADFDMQLNQSDSLKKNLFASNGYGFATDLSYAYINEKKKFFINVSVEDLGFIEWNNQSSQIKADSSFNFTGITSSSLFNFSDSVKGQSTNLDSVYVQPFLNHRSYTTYTTILPAIFTLSAGKEIKTTLPGTNIISVNVNYRINANYTPMTWIELSHESMRGSTIKLDFAYGGYSAFFINAAYEKKFESGWNLSLVVSHIYDMINYNNGRGQGAFVSLKKYI